MPNTSLATSMVDLLSHIKLPAAEKPLPPSDPALTDPAKRISDQLDGSLGVVDSLLAEVEEDLMQGRTQAAGTALGLVGTRISLDKMRGSPEPLHVEWLAAHLREAAKQMAAGHVGQALKDVRLARLALRP